MCGEHADRAGVGAVGAGSSPHVRGARNANAAESPSSGIIPACAGSTSTGIGVALSRRDHPRMCGEHEQSWIEFADYTGSSPHVRGAHNDRSLSNRFDGIIPACAGSTRYRWPKSCRRWDHPRMCGEHMGSDAEALPEAGSSPHVRGALAPTCRRRGQPGIIPACAGSTNCRYQGS